MPHTHQLSQASVSCWKLCKNARQAKTSATSTSFPGVPTVIQQSEMASPGDVCHSLGAPIFLRCFPRHHFCLAHQWCTSINVRSSVIQDTNLQEIRIFGNFSNGLKSEACVQCTVSLPVKTSHDSTTIATFITQKKGQSSLTVPQN